MEKTKKNVALPLHLKDRLIMSKVPDLINVSSVLNVGCGNCRICWHMIQDGYPVISTDYETTEETKRIMDSYKNDVNYHNKCDIFNLTTFPVESADVVICSEVLEHLVDYKNAFTNLLKLTKKRLIITIPREKSFNHPSPPPEGHCNWWSDTNSMDFKDIREFIEMAKPYKITIEKGMTKKKDYNNGQRCFIIVIDKEVGESTTKVGDLSTSQMSWDESFGKNIYNTH
jgi:ubiquinone/menaquinone biosynthesis C-methylase UbiE